jgi:hypothetical protein
MKQLTYEGYVEHIIDAEFTDCADDNIIDAEFTEISEPSWMERASQIAFYNYVQNINTAKKPKIISVVC